MVYSWYSHGIVMVSSWYHHDMILTVFVYHGTDFGNFQRTIDDYQGLSAQNVSDEGKTLLNIDTQ
jgi:hypothetical protein